MMKPRGVPFLFGKERHIRRTPKKQTNNKRQELLMKLSSRSAVTVLLILCASLLVGSGCSHDSSMDPVGPTSNMAAKAAATETNTFVETFDGHKNVGGWSFHTTHRPVYEKDGGNTGGYLRDTLVITFAPSPGTAIGDTSIFHGNYREKKITSVGIDLRSINYEYDITTRYLSLIVMNDNGTPEDVEDDWGAYIIGDITLPSKYVAWLTTDEGNEPGWVSYDFDIPSQQGQLPEGWNFIRWYTGNNQQPGGTWVELMQNVSYIEFCYGDPLLYYILQTFDLGLDNPRITWED